MDDEIKCNAPGPLEIDSEALRGLRLGMLQKHCFGGPLIVEIGPWFLFIVVLYLPWRLSVSSVLLGPTGPPGAFQCFSSLLLAHSCMEGPCCCRGCFYRSNGVVESLT